MDRAAVFGTAGWGFESLRARQRLTLGKSERILLWAAALCSLVLRFAALLRYRFDSDEQQHLHVVWGWTAGLVQYRDYFDNHAPLFHILTAPVLMMIGERRDVLLWMRVPMLLLFAAVIWGTYAIAKELYGERVAAWAAVLVSLFPPFFLKSLEFRTDNLWNALWMIALVLLVRARHPFVAGLLLGCALATSMKTGLLMITLCGALLIARAFAKVPLPRGWMFALLGFAVVPAVVAIGFAAAGAWDELLYCNFTFNQNLYLTRKNTWVGRAIFPFAFAALLYAAWRWRSAGGGWRYILAVATGLFTVVIAGFWILISPRDFLPLMPLAAMFAAAAIVRARKPLATFAVILAAFVLSLWYYADRFAKRTTWHYTMMDQVLRLTKPGEPLMDIKGETIFRRRPFYYAFENITRAQMARGIIKDTVAADVIRTRTYVVQADGPLWPPAARAFLSENFIDVGRLRVAGQGLKEDGSFTIAVPGEYMIFHPRGEARGGTLDGTPYTGARSLSAGAHRYIGSKEPTVVVWAPAIRRGHSPFRLRDRDF
jgi:Dolichyl-phosphate-mannose-protein mannosyltransferase